MQNVRYGMPPVKWGNNWFQSFNASLNYPSKYRRVCAWAVAHPTIPNPAFQTHRNKKKEWISKCRQTYDHQDFQSAD